MLSWLCPGSARVLQDAGAEVCAPGMGTPGLSQTLHTLRTMTRSLGLAVATALALGLAGCADSSATAGANFGGGFGGGAGGGGPGADAGGGGAGGGDFDVPLAPDVPVFELDAVGDSEADLGPGDGEDAPAALKDDDTYLVPAGVVQRASLTQSGDRIAWVEAPDVGPKELVVWSFASGGPGAILSYTVPNLVAPTQLALGDKWLFYVDTRYGDPDVFALELATGDEVAVATKPGAQEKPVAQGDVVVWEDCSLCVEPGAFREVWLRDMAAASAVQLTNTPGQDEREPVLGNLADGSLAAAWIVGDTTLIVDPVGGEDDQVAFEATAEVSGITMSGGYLAWRQSPLIINPDSMRPSDVFVVEIDTGVTMMPASVHAELAGGLDGRPAADGTRLAWLESIPGAIDPILRRAVVVEVPQMTVVADTTEARITSVTFKSNRLAFLAPRDDNSGLTDVWVLQL